MSFEYGLSSALSAVGFMHTVRVALIEIGITVPIEYISIDIYKNVISINPAATLLILALTLLMLRGIRESIIVNNILTVGILFFYQYSNVLSLAIFDP
jgi:amino acid transporter